MPRGPRAGRNRLRNALRLIVGIAVSVGCLYYATKGTDWTKVATVLAGARPAWIAAVVLASLATFYIRAQRWRVLLRPLGEVPLYPALSATAIGFGASAVLPFRVGELLRPALLGRHVGVRMSAALSSVILERLFDMLLVIACFLTVSLMYPQVPAEMRRGAFVLAGLAGLVFVVLVVAQRQEERAERVIGAVLDLPGRLAGRLRPVVSTLLAHLPPRLARRLRPLLERTLDLPAWLAGWMRPLVTSFLSGLKALADLPTVLLVLSYSIYLWGIITLTFMFSFLAIDVQLPLVEASLTTVVAVAAAVFLPQAPGFVGTWQAGCVLALGLFGVSQEVAVGYSLLTWVVQMVINITIAGLFLAREDLSLGQLLRLAPRESPAAGAEG
jgi:hypothetical protein